MMSVHDRITAAESTLTPAERKVAELVPSAETYKQIVSLIVGGGV